MCAGRANEQIRVGLVLGAGGVPGGAYLRAALAELEDRTGWQAAGAVTVVGTSVGALNAARLALPESVPPATLDQVERLARLGEQLGVPRSSAGVRAASRLRRVAGSLVARLAPAGRHAADYDVARAPFHPGVVVVSVRRSSPWSTARPTRRVARLAEATDARAELYASAAVPGFNRPVVLDGVEHIDGAVHSSTNADLIGPDDHDALVVVAPMVARTGGNLLARSHRAQLARELEPWIRSAKPVVVVAPTAAEQASRSDMVGYADAASSWIRSAGRGSTTGL